MLYHGSPYGKETIPIYELLAEKYGFELQQIEVPHPGNEQQCAVADRSAAPSPDYVVLRGWGVMNPVALKTAQKTGFPADHIIGNVWSNSEEDVVPPATRPRATPRSPPRPRAREYPVVQEIVEDGLRRRQGQPRGPEADRLGLPQPRHRQRHPQRRGGAHRPGQVRQPHADRRRGPLGLRAPAARPGSGSRSSAPRTCSTRSTSPGTTTRATATSPSSSGTASKWNVVSDWIAPDWALLRPIIEKSSEAYAAEKGLHDPHRRRTPTRSCTN